MIRRRRFAISLWLIVLGAALAAAGDTLYLRGAEEELGRLKQMTDDAVVFEGRDGEMVLDKAEVLRIQLQRARVFDDVETVDQIEDPDLAACVKNQPSEADFPADGSVTLLERKTYDLTEPGVVRSTTRVISKVLQQRGEGIATKSVWYFEDTDSPEIDFALTVTPDGRVLHLSDAALKVESIYARFPDYRRLSRYRFACKEPRPGSILDVQFTVTRKRDPVLEPFYGEALFRNDSPILRKEVRVITKAPAITSRTGTVLASLRAGTVGACRRQAPTRPRRISAEVNGPALADGCLSMSECKRAAPAASGNADCIELVWRLDEPQTGIVGEPLMPPKRAFVPALTLAARTTWDAIAAAYAETLAGVPPLSDALRAKAAELFETGGVEAIHNHVARNVRTAPIPHLAFSMTPSPPAEVAQRGLANELDKSFFYLRLLEAVGIECVFALVRDRDEGPIAEGVPSIRAFNRSAVYLAKAKRFSNVSSDRLGFDTLPASLQAAPALLIRPGEARLTQTQQARPKDELDATTFEAVLDADGNLDLSVTYTAKGNNAAWMRGLKDLDDSQLRNQLEQIAGHLHPAARLEDYHAADFADLAATPSLTFECAIPGYAVKAGEDLMLFDVPAIHYEAGDVGRPAREHALFWAHVSRDATTGVVRLPEAYKVYALPEGVKFDSPTVAYKARLKKRSGAIRFEDTFDLKVPEAPTEAYADYKQCKELRADLGRKRIILVRQKGSE